MSKILFTDAQVKKISKNKWIKNITNKGITLSDTRTTKSGNKLKRELSDKEKLERSEAKIKLLEAENELLKKTN